MTFTTYDYIIWIATLVFQIALAALIYKRRIAGRFLIFTSCLLVEIGRSLACAAALAVSYRAYFWVYWPTKGLTYLIELAVLGELFFQLFKRGQIDNRMNFYKAAVVAVAIVIASAVLWVAYPPAAPAGWLSFIFGMSRFCRLVQCGIFLILAIYAQLLGFTWKHYIFGLAAGFAVYASCELTITAVDAQFGLLTYSTTKYIRAFSYLVSICLWFVAIYQKEPERIPVTSDLTTEIVNAGQPMAALIFKESLHQ